MTHNMEVIMSLAKYVGPATLALSLSAFANPQYFTVDNEMLQEIQKEKTGVIPLKTENGISIIKVSKHLADFITEDLRTNRHGGFAAHSSLADALEALEPTPDFFPLASYTITEQERISPMINQVQESELLKTINKLSSYFTRFHKSSTGKESQDWIKSNWAEITAGRSDVTIELVNHKNTPQPSVVLTIKGNTTPDEIIIIGGHGDSTAGSPTKRSPGADDNASGIACLTETLRILMQNSYSPTRTIKFISYAGEEGGLLGSSELARAHKQASANVIGVMQLDMTNYKGSVKDIYMMSDNSSSVLNSFVGTLIDTYVKVPWGYDKCGYGCSDHASWNKNGYPATVPFESLPSQYNPKVHSSNDTLDVSGGRAIQSVLFAKLAVAFAIEVAK